MERGRTAIKLFNAAFAFDLEHDVNEWIADPSGHDGIISIEYAAFPGGTRWRYSALVHYKLKDD